MEVAQHTSKRVQQIIVGWVNARSDMMESRNQQESEKFKNRQEMIGFPVFFLCKREKKLLWDTFLLYNKIAV